MGASAVQRVCQSLVSRPLMCAARSSTCACQPAPWAATSSSAKPRSSMRLRACPSVKLFAPGTGASVVREGAAVVVTAAGAALVLGGALVPEGAGVAGALKLVPGAVPVLPPLAVPGGAVCAHAQPVAATLIAAISPRSDVPDPEAVAYVVYGAAMQCAYGLAVHLVPVAIDRERAREALTAVIERALFPNR